MNYHDFAIDLVTRSGVIVKKAHSEMLQVSHKGDDIRDPVTPTDIAVSTFLTAEIKKAYPTHQVSSEEDTEKHDLLLRGFEWVLDPIDGTGNFSHHIPHFSICVALLDNGAPITGAIFNPITNELFSFDEQGAYLNGERVTSSALEELEQSQALSTFGHRALLFPWAKAVFASFLEQLNKNKNLGSANLDLAYLAAGRAEVVVYATFSMPDGAAGVGMVRAAGGEVYALATGEPLSMAPGRQTIVAVANRGLYLKLLPLLHADLLPKAS